MTWVFHFITAQSFARLKGFVLFLFFNFISIYVLKHVHATIAKGVTHWLPYIQNIMYIQKLWECNKCIPFNKVCWHIGSLHIRFYTLHIERLFSQMYQYCTDLCKCFIILSQGLLFIYCYGRINSSISHVYSTATICSEVTLSAMQTCQTKILTMANSYYTHNCTFHEK